MNTKLKMLGMAMILLGLLPPALAEVVAVVGAKSDAGAMNQDQVAQLFLGKSTLLTPIDQPENTPVRNEFYKKVADKEPSQAKALWAKLIFTGKASQPREVANSAEVKKVVASDPKAIGYIEKSAVDASVKVVLDTP
jgi:ABC-type phosphate transport system substrate-binding protein